MTFSISCPTCREAVPVPLGLGGRYVRCAACRTEFLVIDEESLPEGDVVEFVPPGTEPTVSLKGIDLVGADAAAALPADESLRPLANGSLFLGGVSISLLCIPAFAVLSSVCGIVLGLVSLNTTERRRALVGVVLNVVAMMMGLVLFLQGLHSLVEQAQG